MTAWRLLLTRPAAEGEALAALLEAHGLFGYSLPMLDIQALPETSEQRTCILELDRYHAVIAISKPAARLGCERIDIYWPQLPLAPHWFAVGPGTAAVLADFGIDAVWPDGKDSETLLALPELNEALAVPEPKVLLLRGEGGREALHDGLVERGAQVDALALYRRSPSESPAGHAARVVQAERLNGLVVSSGQGFEHLQRASGDAWRALSQLPLFVPSARVAALARDAGCTRIVDCRGASNEALLAALAISQPEE
jgi:uroporphyrinogen-III synthase